MADFEFSYYAAVLINFAACTSALALISLAYESFLYLVAHERAYCKS